MTTARDVIASDALLCAIEDAKEQAAYASSGNLWEQDFLSFLLSAPDSVPQELAALLNPWRPIETAPKDDTIFDAWLGDASEEDVEFYCTPGTRRSPSWKWYNGKFRPVGGLTPHAVLVTLVQPTHWLPLPAPPSEIKT